MRVEPQDDLQRVFGHLNTLVTFVNGAKVEVDEAAQAKIRVSRLLPQQIPTNEQKNILAFAGAEIRVDWFSHAQSLITSRANIAGEENLIEMYFYYLVVQEQIDSDDFKRAKLALIEAQAQAKYAKLKLDFAQALLDFRQEGIHVQNLIESRQEVYGDPELSWSEADAAFQRDKQLAEFAVQSSARTLARVRKETETLSQDLAETQSLIQEARQASADFTPKLSSAFLRPWGYPVVDRTGRLYRAADWRQMREDLERANPQPKGLRAFARRACARFLKHSN